MSFLDWENKYKVNVEIIDEQHEHLFEIVNNMYDSIVRGDEQNALEEILSELIDYTVYHFETEEKLFKDYGYPEYDEHKNQHDDLCKQALELQEQFKLKVVTITFEVMDFLRGWLQDHTTSSDLKFADFMRTKA
jgi:hemerythrin